MFFFLQITKNYILNFKGERPVWHSYRTGRQTCSDQISILGYVHIKDACFSGFCRVLATWSCRGPQTGLHFSGLWPRTLKSSVRCKARPPLLGSALCRMYFIPALIFISVFIEVFGLSVRLSVNAMQITWWTLTF